MEILREVEARRITGRLSFLADDHAGEVELVGGQIALDHDPMADGTDPVELLLRLRSGHYAVHARLPTLPVTQGDEDERRGSLGVHRVADLMAYCETGAITGTLELVREQQIVEVVYEGGELLVIRIDGREDSDLAHVFAWDDGTFRIAARASEDVRSRVPPMLDDISSAEVENPLADLDGEPTTRHVTIDGAPTTRLESVRDGEPTTRFVRARRDDTGRQLLRVVEMALSDVVDRRERARPKPSSPPIAHSAPPPRPRRERRDGTVKVVYLGDDDGPQRVEVPARVVSERRGTNREGTNREGTNREGTNREGTNREGTNARAKAEAVSRALPADAGADGRPTATARDAGRDETTARDAGRDEMPTRDATARDRGASDEPSAPVATRADDDRRARRAADPTYAPNEPQAAPFETDASPTVGALPKSAPVPAFAESRRGRVEVIERARPRTDARALAWVVFAVVLGLAIVAGASFFTAAP